MDDHLENSPSGISHAQLKCLKNYRDDAANLSVDNLRGEVAAHLGRAEAAYQRSRIVNLRLASAIANAIETVLNGWNSLESNERAWLAGAIFYFAKCDDDEPDFDSPIGFEDDAEILNACLRFAGLDDLCVNAEDYDDV